MTSDTAPRLNVRAQLSLQVDELRATLTADGSQLTLRTDEIGGLVTEAMRARATAPGPRTSIRQLAGATARRLDTNGLSARLVGDNGTVIEFGRDCSTPGSRLLFADAHVRVNRPWTLAAAGVDFVRTSTKIRRRAGYAATVLTAIVVFARVRQIRWGWP